MYRDVLTLLQSQPALELVFGLLEEHPDLDVYVVGGVARDAALGRVSEPKDFDFMLRGRSVGAVLDAMGGAGSVRCGPFGSPRLVSRGCRDLLRRHADRPVLQWAVAL